VSCLITFIRYLPNAEKIPKEIILLINFFTLNLLKNYSTKLGRYDHWEEFLPICAVQRVWK